MAAKIDTIAKNGIIDAVMMLTSFSLMRVVRYMTNDSLHEMNAS
jgi:hypothetical protein